MERQLIIYKLDELYDKADKNNIWLNETELEYKESVADWIENLTITKTNDLKTSTEIVGCYTCSVTKGTKPKGQNYCNMCDHYF